jgi:hypothetical protein
MNRVAGFILLISVCACHKHEEATPAPIASASSAPIGSAEIQQVAALLHSAAVASADPSPGLGLVGTNPGPGDGGETIGLGRLSGNTVHAPSVRQGTPTVIGRLPAEVIQRIIRQHFPRFRACYENGLRSNPNLAGTVVTKFVIDRAGNVTTSARDASTTITDATVVSCVTRIYSDLSFPIPEGGIVVVTSPLTFAPSD